MAPVNWYAIPRKLRKLCNDLGFLPTCMGQRTHKARPIMAVMPLIYSNHAGNSMSFIYNKENANIPVRTV
jgi:hypothetical protein